MAATPTRMILTLPPHHLSPSQYSHHLHITYHIVLEVEILQGCRSLEGLGGHPSQPVSVQPELLRKKVSDRD